MTQYRVDNIPLPLRPFYLLISCVLGLLMFLISVCLHMTCRFRFEGKEYLKGGSNFIFCLWHDNAFPYFVTFLRHKTPHIWMNHPAWLMKPIHVLIRLIGVRGLILGSTGNEGQEAASQLVCALQEGYSTVVLVDGPHGPPRVLKKGVLHMALQSGVPIIPMKIITPRRLTLKTWDAKRLPLPFSTVRVRYEKPIQVTERNFQESERELIAGLGEADLR